MTGRERRRTGRARLPVRVMILDDSAVLRTMLRRWIDGQEDLCVVAEAADPFAARELLFEARPDVLTLDIQMPRMDGLSFLERLMRHSPMPVVVFSTLARERSAAAVRALGLGAVAAVGKSAPGDPPDRAAARLLEAIRLAARASIRRADETSAPTPVAARGDADPRRLICLGASTGGTQAIEHVLSRFPRDAPPVAVVQHLPTDFTRAFAERLDALSAIDVREASRREVLLPGTALIAPGDRHLVIETDSDGKHVACPRGGPRVHYQRPSVDVLFRSAAEAAGVHVAAALLTGMGRDGAAGLLEIRRAGGHTVAQDEASCVVFGMPREAIALNAACEIVDLEDVAASLLAGRAVTQGA